MTLENFMIIFPQSSLARLGLLQTELRCYWRKPGIIIAKLDRKKTKQKNKSKQKIMNRISAAIDRMKLQVESKNLPQTKLDEISKTLDMQLDEYCVFQTEKNIAMMQAKLSLEETQTIYGYLGETLEHFNGQAIHVKAVLTKILTELLDAKIKARA